MAAFLANPDKVLDDLKRGVLKNGRGSTVGRIRIDDHDLVVKRYNIKGLWHALKRCARATRAARSWSNAHRLLALNISTPRPVSLLERRFGPLRGTAYFINEYVEGPRATDFFKAGDLNLQRTVALRMMEVLEKLKTAMISHGDMKATNIIIHREEPLLVDLDAMRAHSRGRSFESAHRKDVRRFQKNWADMPEAGELFKDLDTPHPG
jgi:tRNA A-37 threonylcarbamoyl transferase component Bud32